MANRTDILIISDIINLNLDGMGKNQKLLVSFTEYCVAHPEERFWQAMRNWCQETDKSVNFIYKSALPPYDFPQEAQMALDDTFYEE